MSGAVSRAYTFVAYDQND
jgi:mRNA interferase MazF